MLYAALFFSDFKFTRGKKIVACIQFDDSRVDTYMTPKVLPGSPVYEFSKEQY